MTHAAGLIIAAPASNSGKTLVTLGLLRHLARGDRVASAKVGPDYIDPAYHAAATGRSCLNLDPWAMRPQTRQMIVGQLEGDCDLVICEGVMGLFDGATATAGSTADIAAETGWPVLLVIDARAQAGSAAAVLRGFATHRPDVAVAGAIFNNVASSRHAEMIGAACADALPTIPILGYLPRIGDLTLDSRHLGLVQAIEHPSLEVFLDGAAEAMQRHLDIERLVQMARPSRLDEVSGQSALLPPLGQRIAVASDAAFAFSYPVILDGWRSAGAEITMFSPLADERPDASADAVYLPGGYPELHAGHLANCDRFHTGLRAAALRGASIFGECGGYMTLGQTIIDNSGEAHEMTGLLAVTTSFANPTLHLGYRQMELVTECPLGLPGSAFRGHEFHYANIVSEGPGPALFSCTDALGRRLGFAGQSRGNVMGSFMHVLDREDGK